MKLLYWLSALNQKEKKRKKKLIVTRD